MVIEAWESKVDRYDALAASRPYEPLARETGVALLSQLNGLLGSGRPLTVLDWTHVENSEWPMWLSYLCISF